NVTASYSRTAGQTVGSYTISATLSPAGVLGNYNITNGGASFSIGPRPITVTADAKTKVYGDPDPALTYHITSGSLAFSDSFAGTLIRAAGQTVAGSPYSIQQGTLALSSNYTLNYVSANLAITPALLTVKADNKTMILHDVLPA